MNSANSILYAAAILIVLSGCNSSKDKTYPTVPISDPKLLRAVDFKPGSYFIYQDSATGVIDSYVVNSYKRDTSSLNPNYLEYYEYASYEASSTNTASTSLEVTASRNSLGPFLIYKGDIYNNFGFFILPFPEGTNVEGYHPIKYVRYYPLYSIGATSYPEVYEAISDHNMHSYYSVDSGLIKFSIVFFNGEYHSWELVRQKAIR